MTRSGRPSKPIEQHKAEGTLRSGRHAKLPLLVGGRGRPVCPSHLKGNARKAFHLIVSDLRDGGILDKADRTLVAAAAMHYGLAVDAGEKIASLGVTYPVRRGARDGSSGYVVVEKNPAVQILHDALAEYRQCCDLLGVGPSARARLANMGVKNPASIRSLAGVGEKPTPLRVVNSECADPQEG